MGQGFRTAAQLLGVSVALAACSEGEAMHTAGDGAGTLDASGTGIGGDASSSGIVTGDTQGDTSDPAAPDVGVGEQPTCSAPATARAIELVGVDGGVHVGNVEELGLGVFTLEAWVRRDGYGTTASSGVGGIVAEPIVSKGRGESDGSEVDCNYFMGVDADGHLVADFEDMTGGLNHPVFGVSTLAPGTWHHVAATYDGVHWRLFVDGVLDATVFAGAMPRLDSLQHFGIGTAYDSMGAAQGSFDGRIDEVRVWSRALGEVELQQGMHGEPADDTALVGHWPLELEAGTTVSELVAGHDGQSVGTTWVDDARPMHASTRPAAPSPVGPLETSPAASTLLQAAAFDADDDPLRVEIWGRPRPVIEPFSIVVLPDTQYYCDGTHGGNAQMFYDQTQWIADVAETYDIRAVLHVGDLVDDGHSIPEEWITAEAALETLEQPLPDRPEGVPYAVAIGNHDQAVNSAPGETGLYNQYFGVDRFEGRTYYGGHYGDRNDASYITFEAGDLRFLALFFEYDEAGEPTDNTGPDAAVLSWARQVVASHPDHLVVAAGHSCLRGTGEDSGNPTIDTPFSNQGRARWEALRGEPNLRLLVCGHVEDEGRRTDVAASVVHTLLSDYQFDGQGGSGKLRLITFFPSEDRMRVQTYSPYHDEWYEDDDAQFELPVDLDGGGGAFELLGTIENVASGTTAELPWPDLQAGERYEWFARVTDCTHTVDGVRTTFVAE